MFRILPEELWLKILDEVVASAEDIQNLLLAFPELDKLFEKKKVDWFFSLVLPHLMTKHLVAEVDDQDSYARRMHSQELLKLRLVSKRWKYDVDQALENHPVRNPLMPRDKNAEFDPSFVAIAENHFNYHRIRNCTLGASKFRDFVSAENIDIFLQEMANFEGNPFPGKSVVLKVNECYPVEPYFPKVMANMVVLLKKFGRFVLYLEFEIDFEVEQDIGILELYKNFLTCLSHVPNLKSLILIGDFFGVSDVDQHREIFFEDPESQNLFPELLHLETFEWRSRFDGNSFWITLMFNTYANKEGLRKLGIPLNLLVSSSINVASFHLVVNLMELHILLDVEFPQGGGVDRIAGAVKQLPNHQEIRKFWLSVFRPRFGVPEPVKINELIGIFAEFKFESVILQNVKLKQGLRIPEALVPVPAVTVTSLDLEEKEGLRMSFNFLRDLPKLKFLSFKIGSRGREQIVLQHEKMESYGAINSVSKAESFGKKLRRYFMKACDPTLKIPESVGIWKDVPKLEMLSLLMPVKIYDEEDFVLEKYLGVRFVRECGNQAFFGPRPVKVDWDRNKWKFIMM